MGVLETPTINNPTADNNNGAISTTSYLDDTPKNGDITEVFLDPSTFPDDNDFDSSCSTPYISAPSSPGHSPQSPPSYGFFYSAPASPTRSMLFSSPNSPSFVSEASVSGSFEFEFSARFDVAGSSSAGGSMISADELFLNGQIRPMKLSSHLRRPQMLAPLLDVEEAESDFENGINGGDKEGRGRDLKMRDRSLRRRTRSMSPLRSTSFEWYISDRSNNETDNVDTSLENAEIKQGDTASSETTLSTSASSSRSSSAGRSSKRWVFLKDFLYRSKSEDRNKGQKFWSSISFVPVKDRKLPTPAPGTETATATKTSDSMKSSIESEKRPNQCSSVKGSNKKPAVVGKRRGVRRSAHELHYTANRAQAEEMRRKTYLPYRQGLLGCLGFSSKSYGAMNGFARALNPMSSR